MSLPTPNFVTISEVMYKDGRGGLKTLPAASFVRPVDYNYVPKHVIEDENNKGYNPEIHEFCYTSKGFMLISKNNMRKV